MEEHIVWTSFIFYNKGKFPSDPAERISLNEQNLAILVTKKEFLNRPFKKYMSFSAKT